MLKVFQIVGELFVKNQSANNAIDETTDKAKEASSKMSSNLNSGMNSFSSNVNSKIQGINSYIQANKDKFISLGKTIAKVGTIAAATLTTAAVGAGIAMGTMAMDLEATNAKFETVFGDVASQMESYITDWQDLVPITESGARSIASGIQDLLVPMGFQRDAAEEMTEETMTLVGALTNFNSATHSAEDVAAAMQSALTGEYDSLKALGIQVDASTVKQKAMEMGLADANGEISSEAEAQALLALATEQSGDALAAFNEESLDSKTKMGLAMASIQDAGAALGEAFLPFIEKGAELIKDFAEKIQEMDPEGKQMTLVIGGITAALGPLMMVAGNIIAFIPQLSAGFASISSALFGTAAAGAEAGAAAGATGGALSGIGGTLSTLTGPVAIVIGALIALGAGFKNIWDQSEGFRTLIMESIQTVIDKFFEFREAMMPAFQSIGEALMNLWNSLQPVFTLIAGIVGTVLVPVIAVIAGIFNGLMGLLPPVIAAISEAINFIANIVNAVVALFTGDFDAVGDYLMAAWDNIVNFVIDIFMGLWGFIVGLFEGIVGFFQTVLSAFGIDWEANWQGIADFFTGLWEGIVTFVQERWTALTTSATDLWTSITTTFENIKNAVVNTVMGFVMSVYAKFLMLKFNIQRAIFLAKYIITSTFNNIKNTITNTISNVVNTVTNKFNQIKSAIETPINAARDAVSDAIEKIKGFFNFEAAIPDIKLPHFSISPDGWVLEDLISGVIPSLGITWNAKGGILTKPTVFGAGANSLLGGGEAGDEAILPIENLRTYVSEAVASQNQALIEVLLLILAELKSLNNDIASKFANVLDEFGIKWDERTLAKLVKKYA
jgi:phage-related protein